MLLVGVATPAGVAAALDRPARSAGVRVAVACLIVGVALHAVALARTRSVGRDACQLVVGFFGFVAVVSLPVGIGIFVIAFALPTGDGDFESLVVSLLAIAVFVYGIIVIAFAAFSGAVALAVWKTSARTARAVAAVAVGTFLVLCLGPVLRATPRLDARPSAPATYPASDAPRTDVTAPDVTAPDVMADDAGATRDEAARKIVRWLGPVLLLAGLLGIVLASPDFGRGPGVERPSSDPWHDAGPVRRDR